jgi:putrescine transport system substrate-binding protein
MVHGSRWHAASPQQYGAETMKRSLVLALGAFALATSLPTLAALADDSNVLNLYNWSDYRADDTLTNFTKETGIKVVEANYDSNEMLEAKLVAGHTGYDVVVPSGNFLQHQIPLGLYLPLDKSKIPNLANVDPTIMKATQALDPGNKFAVNYMRFSVGLGYNVDDIMKRDPSAPVDSFQLLFNPVEAKKFADCGIEMLDSPQEMLRMAMIDLGIDPNSEKTDDLQKAEALMDSIKPYIRKFDSSGYIDDLANGDACLVMGYSGDIYIAKSRATDAKNGVNIKYQIPKEGAIAEYDMIAVPKDAPHPDAAFKFINYLLEPQTEAGITNTVFYANPVPAATPLVDKTISSDPNIYPPAAVQAKMQPLLTHSQDFTRLLTRAWTRIKTGD